VSDDRTNVLLVDSYARWEFRYLRNLLFGRDKTVHLQYVLLHPDRVENAQPRPHIVASAGRPYGEAEATALPAKPEEWRAFDVIILGDLAPYALDNTVLAAIRDAVTLRGTLLITVAGPRFMPHHWEAEIMRDLLPVRWTPQRDARWRTAPEGGFRIRLAPTGRLHPAMQMSDSDAENNEIWSHFPPLQWRMPVAGVKEGAEVLAVADTAGGAGDGEPVIVAQRVGAGKSVFLAFDESWRLRYQVGDTFHHRFWGQLLRWGAGERLRAGGERLRMGSDRLTYRPGETVRVLARLLDPEGAPVAADDLVAGVYRGGTLVQRVPLAYRRDSHGIHEGSFPAPGDPSDLALKLEGRTVNRLREATGDAPFEMGLLVRAPSLTAERGRLAAEPALPARLARQTGGRAHGPAARPEDVLAFGPPVREEVTRMEISLWDTWFYLFLIVGMATAEWLIRRRGGLP
jgi:hypothetical protein